MTKAFNKEGHGGPGRSPLLPSEKAPKGGEQWVGSPGALSTVFFTLKEHLAQTDVQFGLTYDSIRGCMLLLVDEGERQEGEV